jgi:hypothetical protein
MPQSEPDENEKIRDVEKVEQETDRPASGRRPHYDEDDDYEDEEDDVVSTLIPYRNGLALGAYYCGVFGIVPILGFILAPTALVLGIMGLRYSRRNPKARGGGHAITGIILGSLSLLGHMVLVVLLAMGYILSK